MIGACADFRRSAPRRSKPNRVAGWSNARIAAPNARSGAWAGSLPGARRVALARHLPCLRQGRLAEVSWAGTADAGNAGGPASGKFIAVMVVLLFAGILATIALILFALFWLLAR
jgi:hypothetical protein